MALYTPGNEPINLQKKLATFFARIDEYYPDKKISGLHTEHKKLGERLTILYRELGYGSGNEMLEAYGYEVIIKKRTADPKNSSENVALRKTKVIEELKRRFPDSQIRFATDLYKLAPDLEAEIKALKFSKKDLHEAGVLCKTVKEPVKTVKEPVKSVKEPEPTYEKKVLQPKEWAVDRAHFERALMIIPTRMVSRYYGDFINSNYMSWKRRHFYEHRDKFAPQGDIGNALNKLRTMMPAINEVSDMEKVSIMDLTVADANKLKKIS